MLRTALLHRTVGTAYERAAYRPDIHTETTTTGNKIDEYSFRSEDAACSKLTCSVRYSQSEQYNKICRMKRDLSHPPAFLLELTFSLSNACTSPEIGSCWYHGYALMLKVIF